MSVGGRWPTVATCRGRRYASSGSAVINGLDHLDSLVLKLVGDEAVRDNGTHFKTQEFVDTAIVSLGVNMANVIESLEVLAANYYVDIHRTMGSGMSSMSSFTLMLGGVEAYLTACRTDYGLIQRTVIARLVDWSADQPATESALSKSVDAPRLIVDHVLNLLEQHNLLTLSGRTHGGQHHGRHFFNPSPKLRRMLAS